MQQFTGRGPEPDHLQGLGRAFFDTITARITMDAVDFQACIALVQAAFRADLVALLAVKASVCIPMQFRRTGQVNVRTPPQGGKGMAFK